MSVDVVLVCLPQAWYDSECSDGVSATGLVCQWMLCWCVCLRLGMTEDVVMVCLLPAWCDSGCGGGVSATGLV